MYTMRGSEYSTIGTSRTRQAVERKDVQEEFFKLLILSYKMNNVSIYPKVTNVSDITYPIIR